MKNPWVMLPLRAPYVLAADAPYVAVFNRAAPKGAAIDTTLMPVPFNGDPKAPVIILALNPGWSPRDGGVHRDATFRRLVRESLAHQRVIRPFMPLDGDPTRPGAQWWRRNLKAVLAEVGEDRAAEHICCLEYFPYHSRVFAHATLRLPSQEYTFELLRRALARKAVVVLTRGTRLWMGAVPALASYPLLICTSNPRSASISPRNCGPAFRRIINQLRRAAL